MTARDAVDLLFVFGGVIVVGALVFWVLLAFLIGATALEKGRRFVWYCMLALIFSPFVAIGLLIAAPNLSASGPVLRI